MQGYSSSASLVMMAIYLTGRRTLPKPTENRSVYANYAVQQRQPGTITAVMVLVMPTFLHHQPLQVDNNLDFDIHDGLKPLKWEANGSSLTTAYYSQVRYSKLKSQKN